MRGNLPCGERSAILRRSGVLGSCWSASRTLPPGPWQTAQCWSKSSWPALESAESELVPGLWFATQREYITAVVEESTTPFRLFTGYSGWGDGQLESEMEGGGWLTLPATVEFVFAENDDALWQLVVRQVGHDILKSDRSIRDLPDDPSVN